MTDDQDTKAAIERVIAALITIRNLDAESPYAYPTITSGDLTVLAYDAEQDALAIRTTLSERAEELDRYRREMEANGAIYAEQVAGFMAVEQRLRAELERHRKALLLKNSALDWWMGHLSKCGNGSIPKFMREARVALTQDSPPG